MIKKEIAINIAIAGLLTGAATIGARELLKNKSSDNSQDFVPESSTSSNFGSDFKKSLTSKSPEEIQSLKISYLFTSGNLQVLYGQQISIDGRKVGSVLASDVEDQFNQEAIRNVTVGALLSEHLFPDKIRVDDDYKVMTFGELTLNFNKPIDLSIASALIEIALSEQKDDQLSYYDLPTPEELGQEAEDLKWLANADINIDIDSGSFAIVPKDYLVKMSKILQELKVNNMPFPKQIQFKNHEPNDPGGGYYDSKTDRPFTIMITNASDADTIVHETGHFISDANNLDSTDINLSTYGQNAFEQMIKIIQAKHGIGGSITEQENLVEEYASKFTRYFLRGDSFRYSITNASSDIEKEVLAQEYKFFKELFNNREFRTDGMLVERIEDKEIKIGDVIEITDTDIEKPGIFLRPHPTLDIDASYPVVWDEDEVRVLEGPAYFSGSDGTNVEMWKIRRGFVSNGKFYEARDNGELIEGWISREWFGRIISD